MNTLTIVGHLGRAPELAEFASGAKLVKLSLAENQYKKGEPLDKQEPLWLDCEMWGELADRFLKCNVVKGKQIALTGMLQKNYYNKVIAGETIRFRHVKLKVQSFQLIGKKGDEGEVPEDNTVAQATEMFQGKAMTPSKRKQA